MAAARKRTAASTPTTSARPARYRGRRVSGVAVVEWQAPGSEDWHPLPLRLDLHAHSPTGFEWGYGGSGPSQLALALFASRTNDVVATRHYQQLKWGLVASLPEPRWDLEASDLDDLIRRIRAGETFHP